MTPQDTLFFAASSEDLARGRIRVAASRAWTCLICGEAFEEGRIYNLEGCLYETSRAAEKDAGAPPPGPERKKAKTPPKSEARQAPPNAGSNGAQRCGCRCAPG